MKHQIAKFYLRTTMLLIIAPLVLFGCGSSSDDTNSPSPAPSSSSSLSPLDKLIGNIKFSYSFKDTSEVLLEEASFSKVESSTTGVDNKKVVDSTKKLECIATDKYRSREFICNKQYDYGSHTTFEFDINDSGNGGGGEFEHCTAEQSISSCTFNLRLSSDGNVIVNISNTISNKPRAKSIDKNYINTDIQTYSEGLDLD